MSDFPATTSQTARSLGYGFALTVFLSAFLLFQVQPIISKVLLPWFGGSPSVWTTCMLVFQWLLFAGYAYAHLLTTWLGPRLQTWVHGTLLIAAVLLLPILPSAGWKSVAAGQPSLAVATILLACVGLPFFVLSTSGPLLQRWFAGAFVGRSPYRLYALSNAGSLLALLTYPFVVEPSLSIAHQSSVWSGLFAGFAVLCALVGFLSLPGRIGSHRAAAHEIIGGERHPAPTLARVLLWFALGMIPSTMMLAATNQVCADVAPVPFLWLVPLSLYLLSFIICFESSRWYSRGVYTTAFAISAVFMAAALAGGAAIPILVQIVVFFSGSFFCAMFCHGELNRLKPHPQYLTAFYLILAAAGATGGAFVSILAPVLFNSYLEIHVAVLATFLLALGIPLHERRSSLPSLRAGWAWWLLLVVAGGTVVSLGYRAIAEGRGVICAIRNFYGVMRVVDDSSTRNLLHGRINHGRQFLEEAKRQTPTTYFGERSGIGLAMRYHRSGQPRRIGIIGLGAGTLAAYGRSDDTMRFYELDPDVLRLAEEYFTFLGDSAARVETVLGDARLSLEAEWEAEGSQQFDLFVVDAFSGDAIPVHLLTREAMALYLRHLKPDGMLAFHISNRHFDLG
ncbi:MAG: fused MFS/spermidine synthase, partial [Planctomycetota bacterium]